MIADEPLAALLAGAEVPAGSGPEVRPLAEALAGLRGQAASDELAGEAAILAAFRNEVGAPGMPHRPPARMPRRRLLPIKATAAAAMVLSLSGIAAAAYAGALPAQVQRLAHHIIGAPPPAARPGLAPPSARPATSDDPAYGLCTAWAHAKAHGTRQQQAAVFRELATAAGGAGKVTGYCATAARPGTPRSQMPQPAPAPHGTGKPSGLPSPHGSGKPSGIPAPHGSAGPTVRPAPHSTGKPTGLPTPDSTRGPTAHPR